MGKRFLLVLSVMALFGCATQPVSEFIPSVGYSCQNPTTDRISTPKRVGPVARKGCEPVKIYQPYQFHNLQLWEERYLPEIPDTKD